MSSKSDDFSLTYGDIMILKMAAIHHLEFWKFSVLITRHYQPPHTQFWTETNHNFFITLAIDVALGDPHWKFWRNVWYGTTRIVKLPGGQKH